MLQFAIQLFAGAFFNQLKPYMPTYLYSHESEVVGHFVDKFPGFRDALASATAIWAAGPLAQAAIRNFCDLDAINFETGVEALPLFDARVLITRTRRCLRWQRHMSHAKVKTWLLQASVAPHRTPTDLPVGHGGAYQRFCF